MATSRTLGMGTRNQPLYASEWKRSTQGLHLAAFEGVAFNSSGQHEISSVVANINEHGAELNELGRLVTMNTNHLVVQRFNEKRDKFKLPSKNSRRTTWMSTPTNRWRSRIPKYTTPGTATSMGAFSPLAPDGRDIHLRSPRLIIDGSSNTLKNNTIATQRTRKQHQRFHDSTSHE